MENDHDTRAAIEHATKSVLSAIALATVVILCAIVGAATAH